MTISFHFGETEAAGKLAQDLAKGDVHGAKALADEALSLLKAPRRAFDNPMPFEHMAPVSSQTPLTELKVGQWGFIHPSSLHVDRAGKMWMNPEDTISLQITPTIVGRTSRNGFQVDVLDEKTRWYPDWTHGGIPVGKIISDTPADEWGREGVHVSSTLPEALKQMTVGQLGIRQEGFITRQAATNLKSGYLESGLPVRSTPLAPDDLAVKNLGDHLISARSGNDFFAAATEAGNTARLSGPDFSGRIKRAAFDQPALLRDTQKVQAEKNIYDMKRGEWGYTVPWAMSVDRDGAMSLNPHYTVHPEPGGTVDTIVRRASAGRFDVDARHSDDRWNIDSGSSGLRVGKFISNTPPDEWGRTSLQVSSRLPLTSREMRIADLEPGQEGWVTSWGANNPEYTVQKRAGGRVDTLVRRNSEGEIDIVDRVGRKFSPHDGAEDKI